MEPPMTPKPMPTSLPDLTTNPSGKLFGIVYITLTGVIDTIILAAGLWSWVGKSASYLLKLAPLLWQTLPTKNLAQVTPENNRPVAQDWIPDSIPDTLKKIPKALPSSTPGGDIATSLITPSQGINIPSSSPNGSPNSLATDH
ncbi:hypothetical protein DSO57_1025072 [Entomophthora muscae]|uniref:Uncharacterized protein n=1 Tax=Entomophthora muscae TaxID=34485 RepID=A0ACC2T3C1_9FUNG|nr:hypothetical protein DSO57_1025072 [Entomophthora muscae]